MEYRALGATGIDVSVIGFGCGANAGLMVGDDEALQVATVRAAIDGGINFFDTASAYGNGKSEIHLGRVLRRLDSRPVVSTKVVLRQDQLGDPRSAVLASVEKSLDAMSLRSVDMILLHNRVFMSPAGDFAIGAQLSLQDIFGPQGVARAFEELVAGHRVRACGFTAFGGDLEAISSMISSGVFGAINVCFNALNPTALYSAGETDFGARDYRAVISSAVRAGLGVVAVQILGNGELTGSAAHERDRRTSAVVDALTTADESLPRAATRYVLAKSQIATSVVGFSEPLHVRAALDAVRLGSLPLEACARAERASLG